MAADAAFSEVPSAAHAAARAGRPFISIVMPCLDERETVATCVRKASGWLASRSVDGEVIVVDNGSTDGSPELAAAAGARVVREERRGYGAALRRGFAEARGSWLVMGDCDDTYDFSRLDELVAPLGQGYDLVVGNRFAGGIAEGAMPLAHRYLGTPTISFILRVFVGLKVGDSQCGLRAFTRQALEVLDLRTDGMELASEMILKAARRSLRVTEAPAPYTERLGEAKLNTIQDGWRHLRFLLLASPNHLFTIPGLTLTFLGILTMVLALPARGIEIGDLRWQPIFAGGIFLVVGMNALLLGFASRLYTTAHGITNEDAVLRFYHRYLSLEVFVGIALALIAGGIAFDGYLAFFDYGSLDRTALAAVAQTMIIVGANIGLVGALAALLEGE